MKHTIFLFLINLLILLVPFNLSANTVQVVCSTVSSPPVYNAENCHVKAVDYSRNTPVVVKATVCPVETDGSEKREDETYFVYTDSPNTPAWLCEEKEQEGAGMPDAHVFTIMMGDENRDKASDEIPVVSGGSSSGGYFDDRPGKPGRPGRAGATPFWLETISEGLLPPAVLGFALDLVVPELSGDSPVFIQYGTLTDDSEAVILVSENGITVYRRSNLFNGWHLAGRPVIRSNASRVATPEFTEKSRQWINALATLVAMLVATQPGEVPIYQAPFPGVGASKASGTMNTSGGGQGDSHSEQPSLGGPGNEQQGNQGASGGGDQNEEGQLILGFADYIDERLPGKWFHLGVALDVPLESLERVLDVVQSKRMKRMLSYALDHKVLDLRRFLMAILTLGNLSFFDEFIQHLIDKNKISMKSNLWQLRNEKIPFRYRDGSLTGFGILHISIHYQIYIDIGLNVSMDGKYKDARKYALKKATDFSSDARVNKPILFLLKARSSVFQLTDLQNLMDIESRSARQSVRKYYSETVVLEDSQKPRALHFDDHSPSVSQHAITEADYLLETEVIEMIHEGLLGGEAVDERALNTTVKNFYLSLNLLVSQLPILNAGLSSQAVHQVLTIASKEIKLSYRSVILALKTLKRNSLVARFIQKLVNDGRIDRDTARTLNNIKSEDQPFLVLERVTNYLLIYISEKVDFFSLSYRLGAGHLKYFNELWFELHNQNRLRWEIIRQALVDIERYDVIRYIDKKIMEDNRW